MVFLVSIVDRYFESFLLSTTLCKGPMFLRCADGGAAERLGLVAESGMSLAKGKMAT